MNEASRQKLLLSHPDLQRVFYEADKICPCLITCSNRGKDEQKEAFQSGKSKTDWPNSKHNKMPSDAIDAVPLPVDWTKTQKFYYFAGIVATIAAQMNIKIRWGGDFNMDYDFNNDKFVDLPHFELIKG